MKKIALCAVGLAAGVGLGAVTQYSVLEMLGYLPDEDKNVVSAEPIDDAAPSVLSDADSDSDSDLEMSAAMLPARSSIPANTIAKNPEDAAAVINRPIGAEYRRGESETEQAVADKETTKPKKWPNKEVAKSSTKDSLTPGGKMPAAGAVKMKNEFVTKDELAGDRAPKIKMSVDSQKSKKMVVAKPPLDEDKPDAVTDVQSKLSGKWVVVEAVHGGRKITAEMLGKMSLEFVKDALLIRQGTKTELGTVVVGEEMKLGKTVAHEIEIKSTGKNVPTIKGFFYFEGEELNMVWSSPGGERPKTMNAKDLVNSRFLKLLK